VNVFRVAPDGTTEIRLQSHRNAVDYAAEAENVFGKLTGITDRLKYDDLSLAKARRYMIENRKTLSPYVRYGLGLMRTKKGAPITFAAANWTENMFGGEDLEAEATMTTLLAQGGGRSKCDTVNCTWLKQPNGAGPSSDMHVFIGGGSNELHIVPQCDRETIFMFSAKSSVTPSEQNPMRRQLIDVFLNQTRAIFSRWMILRSGCNQRGAKRLRFCWAILPRNE
jgi:hypothetical protein